MWTEEKIKKTIEHLNMDLKPSPDYTYEEVRPADSVDINDAFGCYLFVGDGRCLVGSYLKGFSYCPVIDGKFREPKSVDNVEYYLKFKFNKENV